MTTMTPSKVEQFREYRRRGQAVAAARAADRAAAMFEDLEFMLEHGETPARAFRRLGITRGAFTQLAKRRGRHDLIDRYRGAPE